MRGTVGCIHRPFTTVPTHILINPVVVHKCSRNIATSAIADPSPEIHILSVALEDAKKQEQESRLRVQLLEAEISKQQEATAAKERLEQTFEPPRGPLAARRRRKRSTKLLEARALMEREDDSTSTNSSAITATTAQPTAKRFEELSADLLSSQATGTFEGPAYGIHSWDRFSSDTSCALNLKPIFVVSDCTGESAAHTCRAALGQFESDTGLMAPANIVIFRFVNTKERLKEILERAHVEDALVVFTLVNVDMVKALRNAATTLDVKIVDLWGNLLDRMEDHLHQTRLGVPLGEKKRRTAALHPNYFKMIEAVEFTRKHDDGSFPEGWADADLLIIGVSRSGKTPLSIYLGQRGFRVANLPLVMEAPLPKELFETDPRKVVALKIDPATLAKVRNARVTTMGVDENAYDHGFDYASMAKTNREVAWAKELYAANPTWLQIDVTLRSVEESAARILRMMSERYGDEHPIWRGNEECYDTLVPS